MVRRTLQELNLIDDFLFGTMLSYPKISELFARKLLKIIFGREFGVMRVIPQKVYHGADTDQHGTRLDVYLEEESDELTAEVADLFDVEMEKKSDDVSVKSLPKRLRFYHAKIDSHSLKSGEQYQRLKNVIVIMIMPFDPFGLDRMVYTIRSLCEEEPSMPYDDGARTLFLYTKGKKGNPPEALRALLRYVEQTTQENACTGDLQEIQRMVEQVKQDEEVSLELMKIYEKEEMLLRIGRKEGMEEARADIEREKQRADEAVARAERAEAELRKLREKLEKADNLELSESME